MSNKDTEHQEGSHQALTDAENHIKEACEILQREAKRVRREQESIDAMSKKLDQVHISSTVELNVGGQRFTTSVQTLTKDPNSMLAAMFSGRFEMKPSKDGSFFIDRDGTHFRFILNFLRTGKLTLPEGATFIKELEEEAEFYQIQGIIGALRPAKSAAQAVKPSEPFAESVILINEEHRRVLISWLPASLIGEWRLLFRASQDGFASSSFHSKCDNKGPTITVVQSGGNIFGGFTEKSWASQVGWLTCHDAFLFSMVNPSGLKPTKMPLYTGELQPNAIYCESGYGPTFGANHDLHISNNANRNTDSLSFLGGNYHLPPGQQSTFFTGTPYFTVTDYEVFGLHQ